MEDNMIYIAPIFSKSPIFKELAHSKRLAEKLGDLLSNHSTRLIPLISKEATKEKVMNNLNSTKNRYIYIGTHSKRARRDKETINLVLYNTEDANTSYDDGLSLNDLYTIEINSALTILDACETSQGERVSGEGFMSLYRGFLHAGSSAVIYTIFHSLDDSELFYKLFELLLTQKDSQSKLFRDAKLEMLNNAQKNCPKYWANHLLIC